VGIVVTSLKDSPFKEGDREKLFICQEKKASVLRKICLFFNMQNPNRTLLINIKTNNKG